MRQYWQIDGDNNIFRTLRDAKHHIWNAYTLNECKKYLNNCNICRFVGGEIVSSVTIRVSEKGEVTYSRAKKL